MLNRQIKPRIYTLSKRLKENQDLIEVYENDIRIKSHRLTSTSHKYHEHLTLVSEVGWTRKEIAKLQAKNSKIEKEITMLQDLQK